MADVITKLVSGNLIREKSRIVGCTPTGVVYKVADTRTVSVVDTAAYDARYTARWRFYTKYTA